MSEGLFDTWLTRTFGCKYPIVQGALAYISRSELVAAVSNAGGLGILASSHFENKESLRDEIQKTKGLTNKAFGVNINLFPAARPIDNDEVADVILDEGIPFVEASGGSPKAYLKRLQEGNVKFVHKVPTLRFARRMEEIGCDAVTIVTYGGGGHPGLEEVAASVIIPAAVQSLKIPILCAGGIADGRGMLASLALGACGIYMGTRFMATKECPLHEEVKQWMVKAQANDTIVIDRAIGSARRVMHNKTAERVLGMQQLNTKLEDLLPIMGGEASKRIWMDGNLDEGVLSCGQSVSLINDVPTVKELIDRIVSEAKEAWGKLNISEDG
jgi:nitronate monooxygenase